MATAAKAGYTQDMPPPGGYGPIQYERVKLKSVFGGICCFFFFNF